MPRINKSKKRDDVGPLSAGQSRDLKQLSDVPDADSESVEQLLEEGTAWKRKQFRGSKNPSRPMFRKSQPGKYRKTMCQQST